MYKEHIICVSPLIICLSFKFLWFFLLVCFYSMWSLWIVIYTVISKNPRKFIVSLKGYMFYIFCWLDNLKHLSLASMFGRSSLLTKKLEMKQPIDWAFPRHDHMTWSSRCWLCQLPLSKYRGYRCLLSGHFIDENTCTDFNRDMLLGFVH